MSAPKIPELATRKDGRDRAGTAFLTAERCEDGPRSRRVLAGSPQATSHGIDICYPVFGEEFAGRPPARALSERG